MSDDCDSARKMIAGNRELEDEVRNLGEIFHETRVSIFAAVDSTCRVVDVRTDEFEVVVLHRILARSFLSHGPAFNFSFLVQLSEVNLQYQSSFVVNSTLCPSRYECFQCPQVVDFRQELFVVWQEVDCRVAASWTASMILSYPVQRQRLPAR